MSWAPDYIATVELRTHLRIDHTGDDDELALAITTASRAVDHECNRQFGLVAAPEARTYTARPNYERGLWVVDVDDFQTATGLEVEVLDVGVVTTFDSEPRNAAAKGRPWTRIVFTAESEFEPSSSCRDVEVTARWGWSAIPTAPKGATLLQAARWATRRQAPFGIAGSPDAGSEMRLLARLDPDVAVSLNGYRRPRSTG